MQPGEVIFLIWFDTEISFKDPKSVLLGSLDMSTTQAF
jgi:hypothetical protein